ncbi:hypothetical protein ACXNSR_35080 [Streptomyces sp. NC-S4]
MRRQIRLIRDGDGFTARIAPSQAEAMREALELMAGREFTEEARLIQLGADREGLVRLRTRLLVVRDRTTDVRLAAHDLHVLHGALTACATMFLDGHIPFSEEAFYRRTGFFRENFDGLALGIVEAASEATAGT